MRSAPIPAALILFTLTVATVRADHIEELVVTASHDTRTIDVSEGVAVSADVAGLLRKAPGADVNGNGPLSGIPQYRGMYGPRVAASLDGTQLSPSGPNWMDPPLSYAASGQLESLELYRGIAPVSVAQESIGGAVDAHPLRGEFAAGDDVEVSGRVAGGARSVDEAWQLDGALFAANDRHRGKLAARVEGGDDAAFPGGDILPTRYEREGYDVGYGFRSGDHTLQLDYGYNDTGDSGTPALPMDIEVIEGDLYRIGYRLDRATGPQLEATLFASDLDHSMTNFHMRESPPAPGWRRNTASADNLGFELNATLPDGDSAWHFGVDGFSSANDSDISNPNNPAFFVNNFNDATREVLGMFVERRDTWEAWRTEFGARYNRVETDADEVDGTPAMMMPPAAALRDAFNAADRSQTDDNFDLVARGWYKLTGATSLYLGAARKTRSPSYQERYLWLPLESTGGLADGNLYTGNIELDPEVSHQLEFGLDYSGSALTLSPRFFYNKVDDYIQGTPSEVVPATMFVRMMNASNGTANPDPLQFNNVDAVLYGFDMDWALTLDEQWSLSGLVNYVRGERDDSSDDDLYRIAPPNATVRLGYTRDRFGAQLEGTAYAEQDNVSETNRETASDGYGVINVMATWRASRQLHFAAGVDNLLDKRYRPHLGGINRARNPDIALRERLPAEGINAFARVVYEF